MPNRKSILLVEDEERAASDRKKALERYGHRVIIAGSGEEAINRIRTTAGIGLILMDIDLGEGRMDGTHAAQMILSERDVPILFLSGSAEPEMLEKTRKITSYGYVLKDSGETVLSASIRMALRLHEAYSTIRENERSPEG